MNLALFDFDGTITNKDSLEEFIIYARGASRYYMGLLFLSPVLILYKLKIIPNYRAKEILMAHFFKGMSQEKFEQIGRDYSLNEIDKIVRPAARKAIEEHQRNGDAVAIVSASMKSWLQPWCEKHKITLISTEMEFEAGTVTGRFQTKNCHGTEKENRVRALYNLEVFSTITAYGDSSGDEQLLAMADKSFYKPFR